jgi:hypothetical protein
VPGHTSAPLPPPPAAAAAAPLAPHRSRLPKHCTAASSLPPRSHGRPLLLPAPVLPPAPVLLPAPVLPPVLPSANTGARAPGVTGAGVLPPAPAPA